MWMEILKKEVEKKGVKQVAKELELSRSTISLCVQSKYRASTAKIEKRVKTIYGTEDGIKCPVLGIITPMQCVLKHNLAKKIGMKAGNPETLKLYKACMKCSIRKD